MVKLRTAMYCNLKFLLIFLVIYGHLIESRIWQEQILMIQYRLIYLIHMPLFSFLSGLFIKTTNDCKKQLSRLVPVYILTQLLAAILVGDSVKPFTPYWHLWYLLSNCIWLCLAWGWLALFHGKCGVWILLGSALLGCAVGYADFIGRAFSLSRSVVFLPYFWLGLLCDPKTKWNKFRHFGACALATGFIIALCVWNYLPTKFLYHATAYGKIENGAILRLTCYFLAALFGFAMLTLIPEQRFWFTKLGADTTPAYLLHAPIVLYLRRFEVIWPIYLLIAMAILCFVFVALRWNSDLYGIVGAERRRRFGEFSKGLCISDGEYEKAFKYIDVECLKEEWTQRWFDEKTLETIDQDAFTKFCEYGQKLEASGGISAYEYVGISFSGQASDGAEVYRLLFKIEYNGGKVPFEIMVTDDGVQYFSGSGSFESDPLAQFAIWAEYLWQQYEGCYFDTDINEYIYPEQ